MKRYFRTGYTGAGSPDSYLGFMSRCPAHPAASTSTMTAGSRKRGMRTGVMDIPSFPVSH